MTWYYLHQEQTVGPVTEAELEALIASGTLSSEVQVWCEGMAEWQAYDLLKPSAPRGLQIAPQALAVPSPSSTHQSQAAAVAPDIDIAPFGHRIAAKLVDLAFLALCIAAVVFFCQYVGGVIDRLGGPPKYEKSLGPLIFKLGGTLLGVGIAVLMRHRAKTRRADPVKRSLGKRLMNLAVVDSYGHPIGRAARFSRALIQLIMVGVLFLVSLAPLSLFAQRAAMRPPTFNRAPGAPPQFQHRAPRAERFLIPFMVALLFSQAGYAVAFFNRDRRGLHDFLCSTRVILYR